MHPPTRISVIVNRLKDKCQILLHLAFNNAEPTEVRFVLRNLKQFVLVADDYVSGLLIKSDAQMLSRLFESRKAESRKLANYSRGAGQTGVAEAAKRYWRGDGQSCGCARAINGPSRRTGRLGPGQILNIPQEAE